MGKNAQAIDMTRLFFFFLKRLWIIVICMVIGFAGMYLYSSITHIDTYTAYATMYVINGNPNLVNYQYTNASDLNSAVLLMDTYLVVIRSNKVMSVVAERLIADYPDISTEYISESLSMGSVAETGVLRINCKTSDAKLSMDICNAVASVAPSEIIRVVNAGSIEVIDYADEPLEPDEFSPLRKGIIGGLAGGVLSGVILLLLFLMNHKVTDVDSITERYTPPVLTMIPFQKKSPKWALLQQNNPSLEVVESYAKLRMNLFYTLVERNNRIVVITSSVSGEGKTTIAANLAISCAMSGKRVLLVDADMRRACMRDYFDYDENRPGLSEALVGSENWWDVVINTEQANLKLLPAGHLPPNPAELLSLQSSEKIFEAMQQDFDLILLDMPPINIVADPLVVSRHVAGCLLVIRQGYSDHRAIKDALTAAEMTGINILGFVYNGRNVIKSSSYYNKKYYKKNYYRNPAGN